ncbi:uncharacterized protein LOC111633915 [Centruroides sculpturatus]|uniref:uncharacterized protein LOC111633915 n=1 Tax=Centruroides sculpturatus TaxID=218467 RepID=UPI000C6DDBCF|nr:uncharacterized protein LOC111633915 [Centruroides sculpturatus]
MDQIILQGLDGEVIISSAYFITSSKLFESMVRYYPQTVIPNIYFPVTVKIIHQVVKFMEEGRTELTSLDNEKDVYYFSNSYKIYYLRNFCNKYILSFINNENIFNIYEFACNVADNYIRYECWKWFDEECEEVFKKSNCSNCNKYTISTLVSRPIYKWMNEADVFRTVYYWAETKVNKSSNLRTIIELYLPKIRFLAIRPECFQK